MNTWIVTTKRGNQVIFGNDKGWDAFMLSLLISKALISPNGFYIPFESIDSILPAPENAPQPKSMAEVVRLVPKTDGAA